MTPDEILRSAYGQIFPSFVAVSVWRGEELRLQYPEEEDLVRGVAPARAQAFVAGRQCAHQVLATLGAEGKALLPDANHVPVWPQGFVGSISHTLGFCVAVACRRSDALGVGVDAEFIDRARWEIAPVLCTQEEHSRIGSMSQGGAALLLSAKESFFKAYQPLTGYCLDWRDIEVTFDPGKTLYRARLVSGRAPSLFGAREFCGRYRVDSRYVYTGLLLPWRAVRPSGNPHRQAVRAVGRRTRWLRIIE